MSTFDRLLSLPNRDLRTAVEKMRLELLAEADDLEKVAVALVD
jgi:hypothetical protein